MPIVKEKLNGNYTMISNELLRCNNSVLTAQEKVVLLYCLSFAENWNFNTKKIAADLGFRERKIQDILKELAKKGYVKREQVNNGLFGHMIYTIYSNPALNDKYLPSAGNPTDGNPADGKATDRNPTVGKPSVGKSTYKEYNNKENQIKKISNKEEGDSPTYVDWYNPKNLKELVAKLN